MLAPVCIIFYKLTTYVLLLTVSVSGALENGDVSESIHRIRHILPQEGLLQQSVGLQALAAPRKHDSV